MLKYNYAFDNQGNVISIVDVPDEGHLEKEFFCFGCGGPMVAAIGPKRRYFRHKAYGDTCHPNSYIHKLAEIKIKERFDDKTKPFYIKLDKTIVCSRECELGIKDKCKEREKGDNIDLHDYFDTCTCERRVKPISIDSSSYFVADLILTHSKYPKRKPVIIEIWVTHENSEWKRNSGIKIIEIRIPNDPVVAESEIEQICCREIIASDDPSGNATLTNFERKEMKPLNRKIIKRVDLFSTGKLYAYGIGCEKLHNISHYDNPSVNCIYSINLAVDSNFDNEKACRIIQYWLQQKGVIVAKKCCHCIHGGNFGTHCRLSRTRETPSHLKGDEATFCPSFNMKKSLEKKTIEELNEVKLIEVTSESTEIVTDLAKMTIEERQIRWNRILYGP